jgi:hypothetical protein
MKRESTRNPPAAKTDGKSQADKFKDLARDVGADEDEEAFDRALGKIARAQLPKEPDAKKG